MIIYEYLGKSELDRIRYAVVKRGLEDIQRGYKLENTSILIESLLIWGWATESTTLLIKECFLRRWKLKIKKLIKEVERLKINLNEFYDELLAVDEELNTINVSRETSETTKSKVDEIEEKLTEETPTNEKVEDETSADESANEN